MTRTVTNKPGGGLDRGTLDFGNRGSFLGKCWRGGFAPLIWNHSHQQKIIGKRVKEGMKKEISSQPF